MDLILDLTQSQSIPEMKNWNSITIASKMSTFVVYGMFKNFVLIRIDFAIRLSL